ncbi:cytochrome P450 [Xylaria arbuscula]|nr:cytochrome P450 [Xylaria arbuscula]
MAPQWVSVILALSLAFYWIASSIYQLFFHSLSRYPGSPVAVVLNSWYEGYWNYHQKGQMIFELERLHKLHGPVARIGPNDLSVNDPEIYLQITQAGPGFTKEPEFYKSDPQRHRIRRKVLTPALSNTRISEMASTVLKRVKQLLTKFDAVAGLDESINFTSACHALTLDIVAEIVLGESSECITEPGFRNEFMNHLDAAFDIGLVATAFPVLTAAAMELDWTSWRSGNLYGH